MLRIPEIEDNEGRILMGLSGILLKKRAFVDVKKILKDLEMAAIQVGLEFRIGIECEKNEDGSYNYLTLNIANTFEEDESQQQMLIYVYDISSDDYIQEADRVKQENLIEIVNIEDFHGCENILLDFLNEYLKWNQDDYFWSELDWYYTYEDIARIKRNEYDSNWCYKSPIKD